MPPSLHNSSGGAPHRVWVTPTSGGLENAALWRRDPRCASYQDRITDAILDALEPFLGTQARRACRISHQQLELEDALQHARLGVLKALESWEPSKGRYWTWCYQCVRSALRDALRKIVRETPQELGESVSAQDCHDIELHLDLYQALTSLPERTRRVIEMRYLDGLTLDEIALEIGVTRARVQQIDSQGRALLRERLAHLILDAPDRDPQCKGSVPMPPDSPD